VELYLHSPNTPSWRGTQLKHRDDFTFWQLMSRKPGVPVIRTWEESGFSSLNHTELSRSEPGADWYFIPGNTAQCLKSVAEKIIQKEYVQGPYHFLAAVEGRLSIRRHVIRSESCSLLSRISN